MADFINGVNKTIAPQVGNKQHTYVNHLSNTRIENHLVSQSQELDCILSVKIWQKMTLFRLLRE